MRYPANIVGASSAPPALPLGALLLLGARYQLTPAGRAALAAPVETDLPDAPEMRQPARVC